MAEYCLECFNKFNKTDYKKNEVTLRSDLCEGCGTVKPCVICLQKENVLARIKKYLQGK